MNKRQLSTITCAVIAGCAAFFITMAALAEDGQDSLRDIAGAKAAGPSQQGSWHGRHWRVRCERRGSLRKALARARPGTVLRIYGTCYEAVTITTDNLTLRGVNGATIDGSGQNSEAVILIDGARGFTLENLTVQNGADQGVLATHQAQGVLKDITSRNNGTVGLAVDRSHLDVENIVLEGNNDSGMDAFTSSTVVLKGRITATGNRGDGLVANGKTFLELRGATVDASQNGGSGVSVINDSRLQIFSFPEAQGSSVNADSNGFAGIGLLGSELGVVGSQFAGSGANVISATGNGVGFFMPAGAILSPHATAKFIAEGNSVGFVMEDGASAVIVGGLNVAKNGAGISAVGAGTLTFVSVPPNPSSILENAVDVDFGFGTRVTMARVRVESVICDETVLSRGFEGCN